MAKLSILCNVDEEYVPKVGMMEDLNSIHEEGQLDEEMQFLCNVDEEYVPKCSRRFVNGCLYCPMYCFLNEFVAFAKENFTYDLIPEFLKLLLHFELHI
ncbi:hypothetical protein PIB30_000708 [Stylosanthes scabra]|uniref:Uncharacterized protein n=1 Tax=Stylosanthes scabra TaxID=79078 RepID=A0ABU6YZA8_9FABA|nr:hypothetical protein [Stylosanthes scabra]